MDLEQFHEDMRQKRVAALLAEGHSPAEATRIEAETTALKRLKSARDYSYEANMGDYSMASIHSAKEQLAEAIARVKELGLEVPSW